MRVFCCRSLERWWNRSEALSGTGSGGFEVCDIKLMAWESVWCEFGTKLNALLFEPGNTDCIGTW